MRRFVPYFVALYGFQDLVRLVEWRGNIFRRQSYFVSVAQTRTSNAIAGTLPCIPPIVMEISRWFRTVQVLLDLEADSE
jgi:hypothetical protein